MSRGRRRGNASTLSDCDARKRRAEVASGDESGTLTRRKFSHLRHNFRVSCDCVAWFHGVLDVCSDEPQPPPPRMQQPGKRPGMLRFALFYFVLFLLRFSETLSSSNVINFTVLSNHSGKRPIMQGKKLVIFFSHNVCFRNY